MFENISIPVGFTIVNDLTKLNTSGSRQSRLFFKDDQIIVSDKVFSSVRTDKDGADMKDKNGQPILVFHIGCAINGATETTVPFASFRRFPREVESFLAESALMRQLYSGTDLDRFNLIKGHTLKVTKILEGEAIDWVASAGRADGEPYVFKKAKFAVFDFAD